MGVAGASLPRASCGGRRTVGGMIARQRAAIATAVAALVPLVGCETPPPAVADEYPSHLHIDLLAPARGSGLGRALMCRLFAALRRAGSRGVHLQMHASNARAARFYRRLVREQQVAKSVVTYAYPLMTGASMMLVWGTGYPGSDPAALELAMLRELEGLVDARQDEIDRAITLTETDLVRALERVADRADLLSMFDLYFDDPGRLNRELDRLRSVSLADVRAFVDQYFGVDNRAVLTYVPESGR